MKIFAHFAQRCSVFATATKMVVELLTGPTRPTSPMARDSAAEDYYFSSFSRHLRKLG
jgi:hypothetical protein